MAKDRVTNPTIESFNITFTADHAQYWQGHGIAFTEYTHCATGCGGTLREAFDAAFAQLCEQDLVTAESGDELEASMLAELTNQVSSPEVLNQNIVELYCDAKGEHTGNDGAEDEDPDCSVHAGEWHFYVSIDIKVGEVSK